MKAVASRVTDPKSDLLLLPAVDMEDSGPYEIAEPRVITALETYTPSWLQTPILKRLAEIVSAQAVMQQQMTGGAGFENGDGDLGDNVLGYGQGEGDLDGQEELQFEPHEEEWNGHVNGAAREQEVA